MSSPKPQPATTTQTTKQEPWGGAVPYLTGPNGIFGNAQDYFNRFKSPTPQAQGVSDFYQQALKDRYGTIQRDAGQLSGRFFGGEFDPSGMTTGRTAQASMVNPASAQAATSQAARMNLINSMREFGGANPQAAIQRMLTGQIDNPYLQKMHEASVNTSKRGYEDMIQSLRQQVMPDIGSQAFASGGYGGSRQGIAEGLALQQTEKNARDLGIAAMDTGNQLYGTAYENAQGRMANIANMMAGLAENTGQFNAGNQQQMNLANMQAMNAMRQFNAGNQQQAGLANQDAMNNMRQFNAQNLQNADQFNRNLNLQQQAARAQNLMQGVDIFQRGAGMQDNIYNQLQAIYGMPQDAYQQALNQYANIISPGASVGGSTSSVGQVPIYNNNMGQILGGAAGVAGLLGSLR